MLSMGSAVARPVQQEALLPSEGRRWAPPPTPRSVVTSTRQTFPDQRVILHER